MKNSLEKIITTSDEFKTLANEMQKEKLAQTIMLITKDGEYSFEFAKFLACLILNGGLKDGELEKSEHYYKMLASTHPDIKIYPAKEKLLVSDSEEIVFESSVKPIFGDKKIFIIKNIDEGMETAQNKLLKTLEEPERNVYFILTSTNLRKVLPTIRSRCNKIELGRLNENEIKNYIGDCQNLNLITALSEGYIGQAEKYKKIEDLGEMFESALALVTKLRTSKELVKFSYDVNCYKEIQNYILKFLSLIYEDLLSIKAGNEIKFKMYQTELENISKEYTLKAIIEVRKLIDKANEELKYNCLFTVVFENLLLNILEVKYLCK